MLMNPALVDIKSIINGDNFAKDKERVFTFIEFVKQFGYDNDPNIFVTAYKDYVTQWGEVKKNSIKISDDFVFTKLVDVLKSITLDYSTYEEQDFISHIDLKNEDQLKGLCALYSRKIKEIAEFYRKKRNESTLIVKKNSQKGSTKSIQEVIYEKIFDYLFSKRDIKHSFESIKRDLSISIENYVDTYSEYFDIPRKEKVTYDTRKEKVSEDTRNKILNDLLQEYNEESGSTSLLHMSSANQNTVDDKVFLDDSQFAISDILFSGDVQLEEIPLVAKVSVDLSQECVGDMLALKNQLTKNLTTNQLDLQEQVNLKKRLYEKFIGVDLWYCYVDEQGNVTIDMMCQAKNPTGNLLNVLNADTATIERSEWDDVIKDGKDDHLELLSHIGLFFKPDKTSILKVNAKDFTWSIDEDLLINDTLYIFPDPNKYGDIGNNKSSLYPLIMECKLDNEIKNVSSGFSANDPLLHIGSQGWYSYYSKQEDDFKIFDNKNFDYSFTSLANLGFATNYQTDIWGNEFCILKGCELGNGTLKIYSNYLEGGFKSKSNDIENNRQPVLLNGGYFRDIINKEESFDYNRKITLIDEANDRMELSGFTVNNEGFYHLSDSNCIDFGRFGEHEGIKYTDHFHTDVTNRNILSENQIIEEVSSVFFTTDENVQVELIDNISFDDISKKSGEAYVKLLGQKPVKFTTLFDFIENDEKIINFNIVSNIIVIETEKSYIFFQYDYDGSNINEKNETFIIPKTKIESINNHGQKVLRAIDKTSLLYNESDKCFYLLLIETIDVKEKIGKIRRFLIPRIYKYDCTNCKMTDVLYLYDSVYNDELKKKNIRFKQKIDEKDKIVVNDSNGISYVKNVLLSSYDDNEYSNLSNFEIPYFPEKPEIMEGSGFEVRFIQTEDKQLLNDLTFSYNASLNTYLIAYTINDMNKTPYLYQHSFKIGDVKTFNDSLKSKVYTLKDDGENYKWNNDFNSEYVNSIPDAGNISNCIIWESYSGTGKANSGFFDTDYWGFEKDNPEINITDFGNNNKSWISYVYLWDDFEYKLLPQDNAQIVGKFEWSADFSSGIQQNPTIKDQYFLKYEFKLFNLMLKYENINDIIDVESAKDCVNEYIYDGSGELSDKCTLLNSPEMTENGYVMEMYRDLIGNISGSTHICIEKVVNKKVIDIDINLQVSGTVDDIKPHVTIIAKQKKDNKVSDVIIEEDIVGGDESPSFSLSNNNINVYLHSKVFDYDNITKENSLTQNLQKAIACDKNSWAFTFGHPDGKAHFGQNDCKLKIRNLMVVDCEEERDEYGIPKKVKENGKRLYVINTDSVMSSILEIDFKLHIEKDKDGIEKVNARFEKGTITSAQIALADENMESSDGEIYINLPDESKNSNDQFVCSFNYDEGKLDIHLYSTININTCNYKCWISYNKFGVPYKIELDQMQNCGNIFANSSSISLAWPFIDKSEQTAKHVRLESAKSLQSMFHNSTCSRFKVRNSIVEKLTSVVSHTNKCFEFDIKKESELDNKEMSDALENVIDASHAFIQCHPSLDGVLNRYMSGRVNYSVSETTDLRRYAEALQILISACPENESLYNELKDSSLNAEEWKTQFWDKAKENIRRNYNPNFHYNMSHLRNAESMFYKKILHDKPYNVVPWPDKSIERYNVENVNTKNFTLQKLRIHDFESIKISAPKLISAPLMFWNRPLTTDEAQFFADNVQDLTQEGSMEFANQNIQKFYERITGKTNPSIRDVFDDVMNLYTFDKIKSVYNEDYNTTTDKNYNNWLDTYIRPIIISSLDDWSKKINLFNRIITMDECSPLKIKDVGISNEYYSGIFPSISLPFVEPATNTNKKWEIVKMMADKGWEVSTNLTGDGNNETTHKVLSSKGEIDYLFRAYEYGGTTGETFVTDKVFRNNIQKQDYLIDACKSVINPIICKVSTENTNNNDVYSYEFWVKLCMAWRNISVDSNWYGRNVNNVSQILGERTFYGEATGVYKSKSCIFTGDDNTYYCENTWFNGSLSDFKNHFDFTFIYD